MREHLNDETKEIYDRYLESALQGGCDQKQAESIAKERTLLRVMSASAAVIATRDRIAGNVGRDEPRTHRDQTPGEQID